ncbi:MAG: 2-amino-4-hydroxy-6-hydroxymethyldihydropteridine diphosphokinase [Epsilonproteobacteria bacterium]|nr:2-amino-4-hydroxy-6-hydroxymethyldihydropteridine diphosphokinase [Campylobacterota bacterium]
MQQNIPLRAVFRSTFFPYKSKTIKYSHKAVIGVGCNVGKCVRRFKQLFLYLQSHKHFHISQTSILYKNPPFGYTNQNDFINTIIILQTNLSPQELLRTLLHIEKKFKRKRSFKNAPRTLDLDIILYDDIKVNTQNLTIPHPFYKQRDSVLVPLSFV